MHQLKSDGLGLEIGPSHRPIAPKKHGFNVQIVDYMSAEQLRAKYADAGHGVEIENIEEVDFVWQGQPLPDFIGRTDCIDVHCWRFTPFSFRLLISDLQRLGLIGLGVTAEFDTTGCEFFVTMGKGAAAQPPNRLQALSGIRDAR